MARGCWGASTDSKSHRWGRFEFERGEDGQTFSGKYGDGNADLTHTWSGTKSDLLDLPDPEPEPSTEDAAEGLTSRVIGTAMRPKEF